MENSSRKKERKKEGRIFGFNCSEISFERELGGWLAGWLAVRISRNGSSSLSGVAWINFELGMKRAIYVSSSSSSGSGYGGDYMLRVIYWTPKRNAKRA